MSGGLPMTTIRITEDTSEAELLTWLEECSRYPQSPQRTASTDTLLDLLLVWAGLDSEEPCTHS